MPLRPVDEPLRKDVRFLGKLLGEVLLAQEGREVYELEEEVRTLAIARRRGKRDKRADAARKLAKALEGIDARRAEPIIRAFGIYFQLVNLAEQHHRIRRARAHAAGSGGRSGEPQKGSVLAVLLEARAAGVSAERCRAALGSLEVTLTMTAHPTQAVRRTILEKLYRIAKLLEERDRCELTPREQKAALASIREEILALWQTDEVRHERPTVGDEVKNVLWYVEEVLWDRIAELPRAIAEAFEAAYGEPLGGSRSPLRLHSWVGGDMDGNPLVTAEVFEDALRAYAARGLRKLRAEIELLGGVLSQSSRHVKVPRALLDSLEADARAMPEFAKQQRPHTEGEPWRAKLRFMEQRLAATVAHVEALRAGKDEAAPPWAYDARGFEADLTLIVDTLEQAKASGVERARDLLVKVQSSGLHSAELELRTTAEDARAAAEGQPGEGADRVRDTLKRLARAQRQFGEATCRTFILSMAQSEHDVLAAFRAAKAAGLWDAKRGCATVDVVPLCETLEALDASPRILEALLADPEYAAHLKCRGGQEVMVGYSDSGKQVGLLAAAGALRRAQLALVEVAKRAGIPLKLFHGRGESVARGGGPAQAAILALPPGSVAGRYKATEQGEALDHKYARPELAMRTLELIVGGALLHTLDVVERPAPADEARYAQAFDRLAEAGRKAYRGLVWDTPEFLDFFTEATPVDEIAQLPLGSRPSKRRAGGLEALRAIPWVFAWTQTRIILPGWYGVGSAFEALAREPGGEALLAEMARKWPFFDAVLDNLEMVLAKTDMRIGEKYAALAPRPARDVVWPRLTDEHQRAVAWVKKLKGIRRLLDDNPALQRSIALRNPYVDPMSYLQVEMLDRKRQGRDGCDRPILQTLAGIAAGLRNTG